MQRLLYFLFIVFLTSLWNPTLLTSQENDAEHPCYSSPSCTASDVEIVGIYLARNEAGDSLTTEDCENASTVTTYLCVSFWNKNNSTRDGIYLTGEVSAGADPLFLDHCFNQVLDPEDTTTLCIPAPSTFEWSCDAPVTLCNGLTAWGAASGEVCNGGPPDTLDCSNGSPVTPSKCRRYECIDIAVPLIIDFSFMQECVPGEPFEEFTFTSNIFGGSEPYIISWSFGSDATPQNGSMMDQIVNYSAAGIKTVLLEVTDSRGQVESVSKDIIVGSCCEFALTCPTFSPSPEIVECYSEIPMETTLTEAEFEALGNGDGNIGDEPCGTIEITAFNSPDPGCGIAGDVVRTYLIREFDDTDLDGIWDEGEVIFNVVSCDQDYAIVPIYPDLPECITFNPVNCSDAFSLTTDNYDDIITIAGTGECAITITATPTNVNTLGVSCDGEGVVLITYAVSDNCGNDSYEDLICEQPVLPAPTEDDFDCEPFSEITCEAAYALTLDGIADITFTNQESAACLINYTAEATEIDLTAISCDGSGQVAVTYTVSNDCDASTFLKVCTIPVSPAPTLTSFPCPNYETLSCGQALNLTLDDIDDIIFNNGGTDACLIIYTAEATELSVDNVACGGAGSVEVTFTVSNNCDATTFTQTCDIPVSGAPTVNDFDCPVFAEITCAEALALTVNDFDDIVFNNGGSGSCLINYSAVVTGVDLTSVSCDGSGDVIVTYTVSNDCDVSSFQKTCAVPVSSAPVLTSFPCPDYETLSCGQALNLTLDDIDDIIFNNGGTEACLIIYTAEATDLSVDNVACGGAGSVEVTFTVSNDCDATTFTQICDIPVSGAPTVNDFDCPVFAEITCAEALALTVNDFDDINFDNGGSGSCLINYSAMVTGIDASGVTCSGSGQVFITYTVTNDCDGTSFTKECVIPVSGAPGVSSFPCPDFDEISCSAALALTAGDLAVIQFTNNENATCLINYVATVTSVDKSAVSCDGTGAVLVTYSVTNDCDLSSFLQVCQIPVAPAATPVILCPVLPDLTCDDIPNYVPPLAEYSNGLSGACLVEGSIAGVVTANNTGECGGTLTITYGGTDVCGNTLESITCIVNVDCDDIVVDLILPPFASCFKNETAPTSADLPEPYSLQQVLAATIVPDCVDPATLDLTTAVSAPVVSGFEYRFTRTYTLDGPNISPATAEEVIDLFWDSHTPVFTVFPEDEQIMCGDELPPVAQGLVAVDVEWGDNLTGQTTVTYLGEEEIGSSCGDKYRRQWRATDGCGCSTIFTQYISAVDENAPELVVPPDTVIECGQSIPEPSYEVSDDCSDVNVLLEESTETLNDCEYRLIRTWTATDACRRQTTRTQIIDVVDTQAPVISFGDPDMAALPNGGTMVMYGCEAPSLETAQPLVSDNCCAADLVVGDLVVALNTCDVFGYYRKWRCFATATDAAGNTTEYEMFVVQYDTTAPVIHNVPGDLVVDCGDDVPDVGDAVYEGVTATDDCHDDGTELQFAESLVSDPFDSGKLIHFRTWSATDACGNVAEVTQKITVCGFNASDASASIGNTVWEDVNQNGIQDIGEPGINGVTVNLYEVEDVDKMSTKMMTSTTTQTKSGKPGYFHFNNLAAKAYQLEFVVPLGMDITARDQGDESMDSDIDPNNGMTEVIFLEAQQALENVAAGFFTIKSSIAAVEVADFNVTARNCVNTVSWISNFENDLDSYQIEFSTDGAVFTSVKDVIPTGAPDSKTQYSTRDPHKRGRGFYRLKMTSSDGSVIYSKTQLVQSRCIDDRNLRVYPNPFKQSFQLEFTSLEYGDANVQITDRLGKTILIKRLNAFKGTNRTALDLKELPIGTYFMTIIMKDWTDHRIVVKAR